METTAGTHRMKIVVVTPEATVLEAEAEFVALPLFDGEIGISPRHSPLIGRLGYGEMRVRDGKGTVRYYVDGGFAQVADDMVYVLTNRATPASEIDPKVADELLAHARRKPANSPELMAIRQRNEAQARAQVRVAARARRSSP